ncbi:DNA-binding CsgD family transcriptional regulator [Chryseobacterium defluvii]|uniref:DNA-binding CsgD family transcriptional regulator n=1 Tax=Chryseobacterium defluvii TaxID=160396 RepID=A0A840KFQ9_9FLAO|nr:DNA-binding CsgD family transcriptional regulator [Chryseobacterium defluvii]
MYNKDKEKAKEIINTQFLNSDKDSEKVIGYIYLADYYSFFDNQEDKKVEALENAKKIAVSTQNPVDMAYVQFGYARYYQNLDKNDLFIKAVNYSINTFSKYPNENFILTQLYFLRYKYKSKNPMELDTRADCFKANYYALKSKNNILINFTYSNLGYYYKTQFNNTSNKKYLDSADISYQNSYKYADIIKNTEAKKRSLIVYYLNYGSLLNALVPGSYKKSLELYNRSLSLIGNDQNFRDITILIYNNIGSAYENIDDIGLAEEYYKKAYQLSKDDQSTFTLHRLVILNNLSRIYEGLHQYERALNFEREAKSLIKEESEKRFANNTKSLEIFYQTEQKNQQIKQLEETNKMYTRQNFLYLGIALLLLMGIIFLFFLLRFKQKLNKQKTNLLEAEKNETQLVLQLEKEEKVRLKIEQELLSMQQEQLQKQALATSLRLNHKNSFIQQLKEKVKEKRDTNLEKILKEERLSDSDFSNMQDIIQKVHPIFFKRLKELSKTKLTNLDLRYAAYIYLNLDNQQISNALKADPKTVKVTKYRLKQKIGLNKEDDLQNFIQNIDL